MGVSSGNATQPFDARGDFAGLCRGGKTDMGETKTCPYCAETIHALALFCQHCGQDLAPQGVEAEPRAKRNWPGMVALGILVVLLLVVVLKVGVYTSAPIGSLSEGRTLVVWRVSGEPFFNSAEGKCLRAWGEVSMNCHLEAIARAPVDRIIFLLPYMEWAYLLSTGGRKFPWQQ
jgi:hypothetical protein